MILGQNSAPDLGESDYFYNQTVELRFSRAEHAYCRVMPDGVLAPVDGVTTICGVIDKSKFLMPWACKMMAERILTCAPPHSRIEGWLAPMRIHSFELFVNSAKRAHRDHLATAGSVGTNAHLWLETSIRYAIKHNKGYVAKLTSKDTPDDERSINCGHSAFEWMKAHNVRWLETESKVYSLTHNYAGTMDGLALVDSCSDRKCCKKIFFDELSLIDWKSSNALRTEYLYQTAAYEHAKEEERQIDIQSRWILRLGKEKGDFEAWYEKDFEQDFRGFLACLNLVRAHRAVNKRISERKYESN